MTISTTAFLASWPVTTAVQVSFWPGSSLEKVFPLDGEALVAPRHVDAPGFQVSTVFADHRHVEHEAALHRLGDRLPDRLLRRARLGPETLQDLAAMFDLDERPATIIAGPPKGHELFARFDRPLGAATRFGILIGKRFASVPAPAAAATR